MKHNAEVQESRFDTFKWIVVMLLLAIVVGSNAWFSDQALLYRVLGVVAICGVAAVIALTTAKGRALMDLARGSKREIRRVVWPTRQETIQMTLIVLAAVLVVGLLLWLIDTVLVWAMSGIIGQEPSCPSVGTSFTPIPVSKSK